MKVIGSTIEVLTQPAFEGDQLSLIRMECSTDDLINLVLYLESYPLLIRQSCQLSQSSFPLGAASGVIDRYGIGIGIVHFHSFNPCAFITS